MRKRDLMINFEKAKKLLTEFKGSNYLYGIGVLKNTGKIACSIGKKCFWSGKLFLEVIIL